MKLMKKAKKSYKRMYREEGDMFSYTEKDDTFALGQIIVMIMGQYGEYLKGKNQIHPYEWLDIYDDAVESTGYNK